MDSLNTFMSIHGLPSEMRTRLREYFQQTRHMHRGQERKHLMRLMSPQLQGALPPAHTHSARTAQWALQHSYNATDR